MKTTPFTDVHIALGAKMHEFAGYNMPIEYTGIIDEHMTVVNGVGVFDVSHMGEFWVKGPNALAFIQSVTSNDASVLPLGKAQYTCFPNEQGGIVDDLLVYHYEPEKYMLVVNAANIEKDWNWCVSHNTVGAELENASDNIAQLAIQGPKALEVGKPEGIKPIGLGARDTLRLEMGFCLYGNDLDDTTSPIEAGLGWITKFVDGKNFTNRAELERQKKEGVTRKLCAFELVDKGIPRHGYPIVDAEGNAIGVVTSGTMSPVLKKGIGMGYVQTAYSKVGSEIYIQVRNRNLKAQVVKAPFRK